MSSSTLSSRANRGHSRGHAVRRIIAITGALTIAVPTMWLAEPASATPEGTPDTSFNAQFPSRGFSIRERPQTIATLADGSVLVGGTFSSGYLRRFTSAGIEDTTFATNVGSAITGEIKALLVSGHTVYAGGRSSGHGKVYKLDDAGQIDATFGAVSTDTDVRSLALASNGDILTGASYTEKDRIHFDGTSAPTRTHFGRGNGSGPYNSFAVVANASGAYFGGDTYGSMTNQLSKWDNTAPYPVMTSWSFGSDVKDLGLLSDGGLIVASGTGLTHINPDGTSDTGFDSAVSASGLAYASSLAIDGSGNIYVGTAIGSIRKYSSSGVEDLAFAANLGASLGRSVAKISLTSDGGTLYALGQIPGTLMRISSAGLYDSDFALAIGGAIDAAPAAIAESASGDLLVGGAFSGHLKKFSSGGVESDDFTTNVGRSLPGDVLALAPQDDGSTLVGGGSLDYFTYASTGYLRRYLSDGTQDSSFSISSSTIDGVVTAIASTGDSVIVGGLLTGGVAKFSLAGVQDLGFTSNAAGALSGPAFFRSIAILGDGSMIIGMTGDGVPALIKLAADGTPDTAFNAAAAVSLDQNSGATVDAVAVDPATGSIYVSGYLAGDYGLMKLTPTGERDSATDSNGHTFFENTAPALYDIGGNPTSMVVLTDGTLLCSIYSRLLKVASDGSFADPFTSPDAFTSTVGSFDSDITAMSVTRSGNIVTGGSFSTTPDSRLAKFYGSIPPATWPRSGGGSGSGSGGSSGGSASGGADSSTSTTPAVVPADPLAAVDVPPVTLGSSPSLPATGLTPGASVLLVNGAPSTVTIAPDSIPEQDDRPNAPRKPSGLVVEGAGFTMRLAGLDAVGEPLGVTSDAALILQPDNTSSVSGTGFRPGTNVQVYIYSTPRLLGSVSTDANGNFTGTVPIPTDLEFGRHTLQVNGYTADGEVRSLSLGVVLEAPKATAGRKVAKATVFFAPTSARLSPKAQATLKTLARKVGSSAGGGLIVGYVQRDKNLANNTALSTKRAKAIAAYLRAHGIKATLATRGDGALTSKDKSRKATVSITYTR